MCSLEPPKGLPQTILRIVLVTLPMCWCFAKSVSHAHIGSMVIGSQVLAKAIHVRRESLACPGCSAFSKDMVYPCKGESITRNSTCQHRNRRLIRFNNPHAASNDRAIAVVTSIPVFAQRNRSRSRTERVSIRHILPAGRQDSFSTDPHAFQ